MSHEANATYSGDPSTSDLDAVRFMLGDTSEDNFVLTDPEVQYLIDTETSLYGAASEGARAMAASYGSKADKSVGDLSIRYSDRRDHFLALADKYSDKANTSGSALTGITGGRGQERDPMFWLGQMRQPGTPVTDYSTSAASLESFSASGSST